MIVSMNMPQKTPNAVMMLRLRFLLIVCQISSQRSKSKHRFVSVSLFIVSHRVDRLDPGRPAGRHVAGDHSGDDQYQRGA